MDLPRILFSSCTNLGMEKDFNLTLFTIIFILYFIRGKKAFLGRGGISNSARYKYVNNSKVASWLYMIDLIYVWVQPFCLKDNARIVNLDISMTWNVCWFNVSLMCLHFEYNRIILKSESISPGLSLQSCTLRPRLKTLERK